MWKLTNSINKDILDDFRYMLIEPLFHEIINYKTLKLKCGFKKYIDKNSNIKCLSSKQLISYLNRRRKDKVAFDELIDEIIDKSSIEDLKSNYELYKYQNEEINKGNYNIKIHSIDQEYKYLFIKFFYEMFFDYENIWILINPAKYRKIKFDRKVFHTNFKLENKIEICPYCDIDTTISISNNEVEHFLPKSKYPFLSMNANNLIPSCCACNKKVEGKGEDVINPVYSPFNLQIGDNIEFINDIAQRNIELISNNNKVENYIKLLKLNKRYNSERIYNAIENKAESIYETICECEEYAGKNMTESEIINYIEKRCTKFSRQEPFSFAIKNAFKKYDLYLTYKNLVKK